MKPMLLAVAALALAPAYQTTDAQARWALDATPILHVRADAADGSLVFERAVGATRLASGTILVADGLANAVRVLDARGALVRTVGREGSGPGEFRMLWWLGRCGADSVLAWDMRQGRFSALAADASVARTFAAPAELGARPAMVACSPTGTLAYVGAHRMLDRGTPPLARGMAPVGLGDATGALRQTLPDVPSSDLFVMGGGGLERPLGRRTSIAIAGDRVYVGTGDSTSVLVYALDGRPLPPIRVGTAGRKPTAAQYERAVALMTEPAPAQVRDRLRQQILQTPAPEALPPYFDLLGDHAGTLWAVLSPPGDAATELRAVAPDGRVLADLRVPVPLRVFEIGRDYVLGAYDDEDGRSHLVMYRLRRG